MSIKDKIEMGGEITVGRFIYKINERIHYCGVDSYVVECRTVRNDGCRVFAGYVTIARGRTVPTWKQVVERVKARIAADA